MGDLSSMANEKKEWKSTRDPLGPMKRAISALGSQGVVHEDLDGLPESAKRFSDGARWKVEIPSVEGPAAMRAVIDEAKKYSLDFHRASQGSGIMMLRDEEITEFLALGKSVGAEVCLFVGPRSSWDIGRATVGSSSATVHPSLRGADQLRFAMEDVLHGASLGLRSILVGDVGFLKVLGEAKRKGDLPSDFVLKTSVAL
ncbi:MAG: hypothetical protein EBX92_04925, partial [Actinobacteria bacterium]|nr:hypothetical protein [Actinomycetota bacterium]